MGNWFASCMPDGHPSNDNEAYRPIKRENTEKQTSSTSDETSTKSASSPNKHLAEQHEEGGKGQHPQPDVQEDFFSDMEPKFIAPQTVISKPAVPSQPSKRLMLDSSVCLILRSCVY